MASQSSSEEKPKTQYTPWDAVREAGKFLAFMAIAAASLFCAEVIVKVLLHGLEWLHGEPYPPLVHHLIDYVIFALFSLFVAVYGILHLRDFWFNLKRGWREPEGLDVEAQNSGQTQTSGNIAANQENGKRKP